MRSRVKERAPAAAGPTAGAPFCICVPARNEEERLPRLLRALAEQDVEGSVPVAICINNTTDATTEVVAAVGERYRGRLLLSADVMEFPPDLAHAGSARASALAAGGKRVVPADGVLITTDADARPPANWVSANLAAIAAGADIVGGRLVLDEDERMPPASRQVGSYGIVTGLP